MKAKRFLDWKPIVGERAIVPGGPANAQFVDKLRNDDVEAINRGHRGYAPLRVFIVDINEIGTDYVFDLLIYNEIKNRWESSKGGWVKRLRDALRLARKEYPTGSFELRATNNDR